MKILIHDLRDPLPNSNKNIFDLEIFAHGKYAPCQGCFECWTKTPASCKLKDSLYEVCRVIGQADDLYIISENYYGCYSPSIKNILDRSSGTSTPLSTY